MAIKLYLESSGSPSISPTPNAGWTDTSQFTRFPCGTTKASSTMTTKNITDALSTQADILIGQWISINLTAGQTITGGQTVSIQARVSEVAANNNLFLVWGVYVFNGTTLQKTIVTKRNDGTEVATSLTNRTDSATSVAGNYTTVAGDKLVIEVGLEGDPAGSNTHQGAMSYGSDSATDLPADDTTTAANNPSVILNDTLTFTANVSVALTGNAITGSVGTVTLGNSLPVSGNAGTITAGSLALNVSSSLSGNAVTSAVGTLALTKSGSLALTGAAVTGSAGIPAPSASGALLGGAVTSSTGNLALNLTKAAAGNIGTSATGSPALSVSVAVSGAEGTSSNGSLAYSQTVSVNGNEASGAVGAVTATISAGAALTGNQVNASLGSLTPSMAIGMTGSGATGVIGNSTLAISIGLAGNSAASGAGVVALAAENVTISLDGVLASASSGLLGPHLQITASGNIATGTAGTPYTLRPAQYVSTTAESRRVVITTEVASVTLGDDDGDIIIPAEEGNI